MLEVIGTYDFEFNCGLQCRGTYEDIAENYEEF